MDSLKKHWAIIVLIAITLGLIFYWYSWRPAHLIKYCSKNNTGQEFRTCLFNAGYPINLNNSINANNND